MKLPISNFPSIFLAILIFVPFALCSKGWAADIYELDDCKFLLSGTIVSGDASEFEQLLESRGCSYSELELNSPGGSVAEALLLARQLMRVTTIVPADASCLSACAIVFMSGRTCAGAPYSCFPTRRMHPTAELGFHTLALAATADGDRMVPLSVAVNDTLEIFSDIYSEITQINSEVRSTGYEGYAFPPELLAIMFSTPADEIFAIETNDQFFAFNIPIIHDGPSAQYVSLGRPEVENMCSSMIFWQTRGWSYAANGEVVGWYEEYEFGEFMQNSITQDYYDENGIMTVSVEEYFLAVDRINIGWMLSGLCRVVPNPYNLGYYDVLFYQNGEEHIDLNDIIGRPLSVRPDPGSGVAQILSDTLHISMGHPVNSMLH